MTRIADFLSHFVANNRAAFLSGSAVLAIGLALGGHAVARGLVGMKRADREVTVRGVAQRDVKANLARWSARYSEHAFALDAALAAVDHDSALIGAYLHSQGFSGALTAPGSAEVSVNDERVDGKLTGRKIYAVSRSIGFTTSNVAGVQQLQANKDRLVQQGLVLDEARASYEYTQLDKIKPEMIADATRDARGAAEKFANDSGSGVGGIKSATQGYFSVSGRDGGDGGEEEGGGGSSRSAASPDQRVRVVTTIDYYLD